jgi:NADH dehydrogenase
VGADEVVWGDLRDPASLDGAVDGVEAVVHLAGVTHARRARGYHAVNVEGTRNLLAAASRHRVGALVHVSTRAISPAGGAYSRSKLRSEEVVLGSGIPHTILRLAEVYGAGGTEGLDDIVERTRRHAPVPVVGSGEDEICPVFVEDATRAIVAAVPARRTRGRTYTIAGRCITVAEFVRECASSFGAPVRAVKVPVVAVSVAAQLSRVLPLPVCPDQLARLRAPKDSATAAASEDLGFESRPLRAGLGRLANEDGDP